MTLARLINDNEQKDTVVRTESFALKNEKKQKAEKKCCWSTSYFLSLELYIISLSIHFAY